MTERPDPRRRPARYRWSAWRTVFTERRGGPLPARSAASRLSAFVYGNILVLASVVVLTAHSIETGKAALIVAGTGLTTYIAHVFAEIIAHTTVPEAHTDHGAEGVGVRESILEEMRDALPIASSATGPALILVMGWFGWLSPTVAHLAAGAIVALRIASIPLVAERIRGNPGGMKVLVGGLIVAALAAVVVVLKVVLAH